MSNLNRYYWHFDGMHLDVAQSDNQCGQWVKFDDIKGFLKPSHNSASAEILPQIDKILWGSGDSTTKVAKCKDLLAKLRT